MKLVECNFTSRYGEIDLVMRDDAVLVFVEVRMRKSASHGHPAETITAAKRQRLVRTAQHYLQRRAGSAMPDCRFDVVAITGDRQQPTTEWFRNVFT